MGPSKFAAMKRELAKKTKTEGGSADQGETVSKTPKLDDPAISARSIVEGGVPATRTPITVDPPINSKEDDPRPARSNEAQEVIDTNSQKPATSSSSGAPIIWHGVTLPPCYSGINIDQH